VGGVWEIDAALPLHDSSAASSIITTTFYKLLAYRRYRTCT
jgi:hypothetical protein